MSISAELNILTKVQNHYIRNNKSNGQKNIRCFPRCTQFGHRTAGFCGSGVVLSCDVTRLEPQLSNKDEDETVKALNQATFDFVFDFNDIIVVAEFLRAGPDSEKSHVTKNSFYEAAPIMNRVKRRGNNLAPLFLARFMDQTPEERAKNPLQRCFTIEPSCWHYGWKSHKHSNTTKHFLRVYAFHRIGGYLKCLSHDDTTSFTISSSKRYQRRSDGETGDISGAPIAKRAKKNPKNHSSSNNNKKSKTVKSPSSNISNSKKAKAKKAKTNAKTKTNEHVVLHKETDLLLRAVQLAELEAL